MKQANISLLACKNTVEADAMAILTQAQTSTTPASESLVYAIPMIALGSAPLLIPDNSGLPSLLYTQLEKKQRLKADA